MYLRDRCECMLANHMQCSNQVVEGTKRCKLHAMTLLGTKNLIEDTKE
jgi:hypothetical protein